MCTSTTSTTKIGAYIKVYITCIKKYEALTPQVHKNKKYQVYQKKNKKKVPGARLGQNQDSEQRSAAEAGFSWEIDLLDGAREKRAHCLRRRASPLHARKCPNSWRLKLGPPLHTAASGGAIDSSSPASGASGRWPVERSADSHSVCE
ncbi:hypothetical protein KSP39_PZI013304 [Platanthera zijinensis]|uniref:Uncharacterized protein n=1 Tax=Platanthera zijinensis TaxID=2320716 RepID=A0AAP0BED0_9ASPA